MAKRRFSPEKKMESVLAALQEEGALIGKFFIIRGQKIHAHYDTFEDAYRAACQQCPDENFIIQQLVPEEFDNFIFGAN